VPFASTNKEMSLDSIFKQANDKIDSAFGVPASIRGVNDNNTYASVRVDQQLFIDDVVDTFCLKIWTRFTHEMNRITGGLGYAITYDLDIPGLVDEEKIRAETRLIEFNLIKQAIDAGFSLDSTVDAFELSNGYKLLKNGYQKPVIQNDKPEVDEGNEVEDAPDSETQKTLSPPNYTTDLAGHKSGASCRGGDAHNKAIDDDAIDDVATVVRAQMEQQIEAAIAGNGLDKDVNDADEQQVKELAEAMSVVLLAYMLLRGAMSYQEGVTLLSSHGFPTDAATSYIVSEATKLAYQNYLNNVARSYAQETGDAIRRVLAQGQTEGWSQEEIARNLRDIMNTDEWRVQRLARTEEHRIVGQASVDAMSQLMNETGTKIYKVWRNNSGSPCEFCAAMVGKKELVTAAFLPTGGTITGVDGGTFMNTFTDVDSAALHPNCHCYTLYEVESDE
jgi:hypothetical protein